MAITNTAKPTTSLTNAAKVSHEETWDTNTSTWVTETRAWNDTGSKITNGTKQSASITNVTKPS